MRRWKTVESVSVEEYFDEITKPQRWASVSKLDGLSDDFNIQSPMIIQRDEKALKDPSLLCYVCKQEFIRPKLLRCLHTFCMSCIESMAQMAGDENKDSVVCPVCATPDELNKKSAEHLPTNFLLIDKLGYKEEEKREVICENCEDKSPASGYCVQCEENLCDNCTNAHKRVRVTREHHITALSHFTEGTNSGDLNNNLSGIKYCPKHCQEELAYFCHTCDKAVCRECTVYEHRKSSHNFEPLKEASNKHRQEIAGLLEEVRKRVPFIKRALHEIEDSCQEIPEHFDAIAEQIKDSTNRYISALQEREAQLLDDLDAMREYKTTVLRQQKERLSQVKRDAEENCEFADKVMSEGNATQVASVKHHITNRLDQLATLIDDIDPAEGPNFNYISEEDLFFELITRGGRVESGTKQSLARVIGEGLYSATVGKTTTFTMATRHATQLNKEDLDIRIETPDGVILTCTVACQGRGLYNVSYSPKIHGDHTITVLARGEHVEDSPYTVYVKKGHMIFTSKTAPVCMRIGSSGSGRGELDGPSDVAITSNGSVVIADSNNHRIAIFHSRGNFLRQFGSCGEDVGKLNKPSGVCFAPDGNIVVADQQNNRIQIFSPEGVFLQSVTCKKRGTAALKNPTGVAVDEEAQILVTDQHNHRVVCFNAQGEFSHEFGSLGTKNGQFNNPTYLTINQDGEIFVTDTCNHRVQAFDSAGNFLRKLGRPGTGDGEFHYPTGIAVDASGYLFVSDRTNRVQVFNQHFRYITMFGGKQSGDGQLSCPLGLDYTPEGRVAIVDSVNNSVKVFYYPNERF